MDVSNVDELQEALNLRSAAGALLTAADMLEHNEAIFTGKWKKGSKAWSGEFIQRTIKDALAYIGATKTDENCVKLPNSAENQAHAELLAIHEAVMNPQAVGINEADTFTVKMVKEFILEGQKWRKDNERLNHELTRRKRRLDLW